MMSAEIPTNPGGIRARQHPAETGACVCKSASRTFSEIARLGAGVEGNPSTLSRPLRRTICSAHRIARGRSPITTYVPFCSVLGQLILVSLGVVERRVAEDCPVDSCSLVATMSTWK